MVEGSGDKWALVRLGHAINKNRKQEHHACDVFKKKNKRTYIKKD